MYKTNIRASLCVNKSKIYTFFIHSLIAVKKDTLYLRLVNITHLILVHHIEKQKQLPIEIHRTR